GPGDEGQREAALRLDVFPGHSQGSPGRRGAARNRLGLAVVTIDRVGKAGRRRLILEKGLIGVLGRAFGRQLPPEQSSRQAVPENTACDVVNTSSRTSLKKDDRRQERIARPGAISSAPNVLAGAAVMNVGFHVERESGRWIGWA